MPARTPDEGHKRFEFRTGIGGLPTLGGMYRAGDPATIPPYKHHTLINMRKTPAGMVTRPGLALEHDTGVQECIDGLTEDAGEQGGALMLYPGHTGVTNCPAFRAVFPDQSADYSEYAFALYGPAATLRGDASPTLSWSAPGSLVTVLSRPFLFRGQAVQFARVANQNGDEVVALLGIHLAQRSFLQASDCWTDAARPTDVAPPTCPGASGLPTPADPSAPPLWPYQHQVGSSDVIVYFDNPFSPGDDWRPDSAVGVSDERAYEQILVRAERIDDPLTGEEGVSEVLYFVAFLDGTPEKRRLVRWDGARQSTEFSIPDDLEVALGDGIYGPFLGSAGLNGTAEDWAAMRTAAGTWSTLAGGLGWTIGAGVGDRATAFFFPKALNYQGRPALVTYGDYISSLVGPTTGAYVWIHTLNDAGTEFESAPADAIVVYQEDGNVLTSPLDILICGAREYVLIDAGTVILGVGGVGILMSETSGTVTNPLNWIQRVGERVYVGGKFDNWNPETEAAAADHHGVYDVTDVQADGTGVFNVYSVADSAQTDETLAGRHSLGCLPAVPNDATGGEGFQAS